MTIREARSKARELVGQMDLEEKASVIRYDSPAVERLGIHEYNW
jgi:beta-glucosidase